MQCKEGVIKKEILEQRGALIGRGISLDLLRLTDMKKRINEFDTVKIINKNVIGTAVDITNINGRDIYLIEDKEKTFYESGDWEYKIHQCLEDDLELVKRAD